MVINFVYEKTICNRFRPLTSTTAITSEEFSVRKSQHNHIRSRKAPHGQDCRVCPFMCRVCVVMCICAVAVEMVRSDVLSANRNQQQL